MIARLSLGLATGLVALVGAGQTFAYQNTYHRTLGTPLTQVGRHPVYVPGVYAVWLWRWGWKRPQAFQWSASTGALVLVLGALLLVRTTPAPPSGATWATLAQIRRAKLLRPDGIIVGRLGRHVVRHRHPGHVFVLARTGEGKTTQVVRSLLQGNERVSVIVHDPKQPGEIHALTAGYRAQWSRVVRYHPLSAMSHQHNPLHNIHLGTDRETRDFQILVEMLMDPDGHGADSRNDAGQHFHDMGSDFLRGVATHGLYTWRETFTLGDLYALLHGAMSTEELVTAMARATHVDGCCHPAVLHAVRLYKDTLDGRPELTALLNTARRALRLWADPLVCRATARSDFTLADLREGEQPITLYLGFPFEDQERLRPLSRLVLRQWLEYCGSRTTGWTWPLLTILDEFQALRRFPLLRHGLNYMRGAGITLCLVTPSMQEVEDIWGPRHPFLEGCGTQVVFGIGDKAVAERFAGRSGERTVIKERESWSDVPGAWGKRRSVMLDERPEPLLSAGELMDLPEDQLFVIAGRHKMRLTKAPYFEDKRLVRRSHLPMPDDEERL